MKEQMFSIFRNFPYKEAKQKIRNWLIEVRVIENRLMGKLIFENDYLNMKDIVKRIEGAGDSEQNNRYNHKDSIVAESNYEENEMLVILQLFVSIFNEFDNDSRIIIYNSFFRNRMNESTAQKLNFSTNKLERLKNKAVIDLAEALDLELLAYYFGLA